MKNSYLFEALLTSEWPNWARPSEVGPKQIVDAPKTFADTPVSSVFSPVYGPFWCRHGATRQLSSDPNLHPNQTKDPFPIGVYAWLHRITSPKSQKMKTSPEKTTSEGKL